MKRIDEIMKEMGFQEGAPTSVKEAFIKHLIRASEGVEVVTPTEKRFFDHDKKKKKAASKFDFNKTIQQSEQLAFDFVEQKTFNPHKKNA